MRFFSSLAVVSVLVAPDGAVAQQRVAQGRAPQAAAPAPASSGSASADGFKSTLTFRARPADPAPVPRGLVFPGFPFLWGWDTTLETSARPLPSIGEDAPTGGVQLDILPWRARVFVDGAYAGRVDDFNGYYQHLTAVAGPHQVVIVERGYEPLVIDVQIVPGRTTTYRGTLSEASRR